MKIGIIDVGGGMRSAFGCGVYDFFMDANYYPFSLAIGVSAGAANLATYISRQKGRCLRFYEVYPNRKSYMSFENFVKKGSYIDLKYVYEDLSNPGGEDEFDFKSFAENPMDMKIVATDAVEGKPVYFNKEDITLGNLKAVEASSALPVICKPIEIDKRAYYDGGFSDPIPYEKAFSLGCDKVVVVLTKPRYAFRDPKKDKKLGNILKKTYPKSGEALLNRAETYNSQIRGLKHYEDEGKLFVLAPDDTCGVTTVKHKTEDIRALYNKGYAMAKTVFDFVKD